MTHRIHTTALAERHIKVCLLLVCLLLCNSRMLAQGALSRCEIGLTGGGMNYLGDLNGQSMLGRLNLGYGGFFRYTLDDRWCVSAHVAYGHIEGGNPKGLEGVKGDIIAHRNLSFMSYIGEASLRMEFNFFPFGHGGQQYHWTPYIFAGLGAFGFNPTARYQDPISHEWNWYDLQPLGTEGQGTEEYASRRKYTLIQMNMPFGLGFKWKPNKLFSFSIEYGFRKTWTDYLDDVSTTYVGSALLDHYHNHDVTSSLADRTGEVIPGYENAPGIKRGDDSLDDWYAYINATISFRLDRVLFWVGKKKCDNKNY